MPPHLRLDPLAIFVFLLVTLVFLLLTIDVIHHFRIRAIEKFLKQAPLRGHEEPKEFFDHQWRY